MDKENLPEETPLQDRPTPTLRPRRTPAPFADSAKEETGETEAVFEEATDEVNDKEEAKKEETQESAEAAKDRKAEETVSSENSESFEENACEEANEKETSDEEVPPSGSQQPSLTENKVENEEKEAVSSAVNTFDWIKSFLFSLTVVIFVFTLIFRGVTVNGGSMLPTLQDREYLIISDLLYTPKTGDIVVVQSPHYKNGTEPLIKRVIATGGQTVRINFTTWQVWVDEVELHEDYILFEEGSLMNFEDMQPDENGECKIVVEENCIFVMGDHRNDSLDSRSDSVGQIDERFIMGRVLIRVTPFERFGKVK